MTRWSMKDKNTINYLLVFFCAAQFAIAGSLYAESDMDINRQDNSPQQAKLDRYKDQRNDYLTAKQAFKDNNQAQFNQLKRKLRNYPLYPYLLHMHYSKNLKTLPARTVGNFINEYADVPIVRQMRFNWLSVLEQRNQWRTIVKFYLPTTSVKYQCLYREALYRTGKRRKALNNMDKLWVTHKNLPKNCNYIIKHWRNRGGLTKDLVWDRIERSFRKRASRRARNLAKYLPRHERHWVATWYRVYQRPDRITQKKLLRTNKSIANKILTHGLMRMSRRNPDKASTLWQRHLSRKNLSRTQSAEIKRAIGLSYAYKNNAKANRWLAQVPEDLADEQVKMWRIRAALSQENWSRVLVWLDKLDFETQNDPRWQYWRARAYEARGQRQKATSLYYKVAKTRSFEGFLAADRLKIPYTFENRSLYFPDDHIMRIESIPAITRARELYFLERIQQARREWYYAIKKLSQKQLKIAAVLAHQWGWHSHVIMTLGKTDFRDDLKLRFPIAHKSTVLKQAGRTDVDPAWAMAVIRRESAFASDARSHAGARGLMQLMPRTARSVARKLNTRMRRATELYRADFNIRLGMTYLRMSLNKFNDNKVLATAAYNAGGRRVLQWLPEEKPKSADIWIETIPFTETRDYCRNVMAYMTIYEQRMGLKPGKMTDRLTPIPTSTRSN